MSAPAVKGYMPLCVTPRSRVCDEQGKGQWPMWKRFDSVKGIVDQYIDEQYRDFLSRPYHEIDRLKAEELFYWYTPTSDTAYTRLTRIGDDYGYYRKLLDETIDHYRSVVDRIKRDGKIDEAEFLDLSLKYAGESEENVFCGGGRVVATVWGMCPKPADKLGLPAFSKDLLPPLELHSVSYDLGRFGKSDDLTILKKSHGSRIRTDQVPKVNPVPGYEFVGWKPDPYGAEVDNDKLFIAQYQEIPKVVHHVRFFDPNNQLLSEIDVEHGARIPLERIPILPYFNGIQCQKWDGTPQSDIIDSDRDYKAEPSIVRPLGDNEIAGISNKPSEEDVVSDDQKSSEGHEEDETRIPELPEDGFKFKSGGCLSSILNGLLLLLSLLLLLLLLWYLFIGRCRLNTNDCGCATVTPVETDDRPIPNPCNTTQASGGVQGYMGYFEMGQPNGTFKFEYNTYTEPDRITIYDGKGTAGPKIFTYEGGTCGLTSIDVKFHKPIVTVKIEGLSPTTFWDFTLNCPTK